MSALSFLSPLAKESRWIKDIVFGVSAYFILLSMFASSSSWELIDHIYTSIFLGTLIIFGTVNEWVIQKRFLRENYYGWFIGLTALNIMAGAVFNQLLFDKLIDFILPGYYFISYYEYFDLVKFFFVYIFLITLLDLSWEWFQLQDTRHKMTLLEKEKVDAELTALTNQVNPHFLFNSLTVVYGLALKRSEETAAAVVKLSDILRYVIYDASRNKVEITSEVQHISNYIDLQRYRISTDARISFHHEIQKQHIFIEPMILLPLVENCFKHGVKGEIGSEAFADIDLFADEKVIRFRTSNNKNAEGSNEWGPGGVGLKNIQNRLRLVYPDRHTLKIDDSEKIFTVNLTISLDA